MGRGMSRKGRSTSLLLGVAVAVLVQPLVAAPAHADEGDKTAVVGPLLDFFGFGATVGMPLVCAATTSSLGTGFQEFGATDHGNALVEGIDGGCATFSEQGGAFVDQGKVSQAPYAEAINPIANPAIAGAGAAVTQFGQDFEPALAPFGPTVAGTGSTIGFLQGASPPAS